MKPLSTSTKVRREIVRMRKLSRWTPRTREGLAEKAGKRPRDFKSKDLYQGAMVEVEHTSDSRLAIEIAMDHLTEDPHYYAKLAQVES